MTPRALVFATVLIFVLSAASSTGRAAGKVEGTFVVAGTAQPSDRYNINLKVDATIEQ